MSKRKMIEAAALGITKELTDQGKLVEAGIAKIPLPLSRHIAAIYQ